MLDEFQWVEKYRPRTVEECILPERLKKQFQNIVDKGEIPNVLLVGPPGCGKTTVARAMVEEIGANYKFINGSNQEGTKGYLENEVESYATSVSFTGGRKYVIIDEADGLTIHAQPAFRSFMEEYSSNCGFILTANVLAKIIPALLSRVATVEFNLTKADEKALGPAYLKRVCEILDKEGIPYEKKAVATVITKLFPDFRKILNEIQNYSLYGKIDTGVLAMKRWDSLTDLSIIIKNRDFTKMVKWTIDHVPEGDTNSFISQVFKEREDMVDKSKYPDLVITLADYQFKDAHVADKKLNIIAMLTEIMVL